MHMHGWSYERAEDELVVRVVGELVVRVMVERVDPVRTRDTPLTYGWLSTLRARRNTPLSAVASQRVNLRRSPYCVGRRAATVPRRITLNYRAPMDGTQRFSQIY